VHARTVAQASAQVSDTPAVGGGRLRYVEVSDTGSVRRQVHRGRRARASALVSDTVAVRAGQHVACRGVAPDHLGFRVESQPRDALGPQLRAGAGTRWPPPPPPEPPSAPARTRISHAAARKPAKKLGRTQPNSVR
jgi:hypothetical protein